MCEDIRCERHRIESIAGERRESGAREGEAIVRLVSGSAELLRVLVLVVLGVACAVVLRLSLLVVSARSLLLLLLIVPWLATVPPLATATAVPATGATAVAVEGALWRPEVALRVSVV